MSTGRGTSGNDLAYPIKLDAAYPCRGVDANGRDVYFEDLLGPGDGVGPTVEHDDTPGEAAFISGRVVERGDELWVEAMSLLTRENGGVA